MLYPYKTPQLQKIIFIFSSRSLNTLKIEVIGKY